MASQSLLAVQNLYTNAWHCLNTIIMTPGFFYISAFHSIHLFSLFPCFLAWFSSDNTLTKLIIFIHQMYLHKFIEKQDWLLLTLFICLHNQLSSFNSIVVQISRKCDSSYWRAILDQIDSKNECLLLSVTFTAKLELVFCITFENTFS